MSLHQRFNRDQTTFFERRQQRGPTRPFGSNAGCGRCGRPLNTHDKTRVYPDHGPAGTYHHVYGCPQAADADHIHD